MDEYYDEYYDEVMEELDGATLDALEVDDEPAPELCIDMEREDPSPSNKDPEFPYEDIPYGTWFIFDEPGMDDILKDAEGGLDEMIDAFGIKPAVIRGDGEKLFLARYEFPAFDCDFKHKPEGENIGKCAGFIDFLGGLPHGSIEIMGIIGELSTNPEDIDVIEASSGQKAAPIPDKFFDEMFGDSMVHDIIWLSNDESSALPCQFLAPNISGKKEPKNPHWWHRVFFVKGKDIQFPIPGEFVASAPRMLPNLPWGEQLTTPFFFAGNWIETLYYTHCKILEVIEPDEEYPYQRYKVKYRQYGLDSDSEITATPTDYCDYKVDDRVAIIRNETSEEETWTWEDLQEFDEDSWLLAPIDFYGKLTEEKKK
jgi:hypothetical protein